MKTLEEKRARKQAYDVIYRAKHREETRKKFAAYYEANREEIQARARARYEAHREEILASRKAYHSAHREEAQVYQLMNRHGISLRDAEMLVSLRDGPGAWCDICRTTESPFQIDHDHATSRIRGILCRPCNSALGHLEAGPGLGILQAMLNYVKTGDVIT